MFSVLLHGTFDKSNPQNTKALQDPSMICNLSNQEEDVGNKKFEASLSYKASSCLKTNSMKLFKDWRCSSFGRALSWLAQSL